jgi:hypothetical protein
MMRIARSDIVNLEDVKVQSPKRRSYRSRMWHKKDWKLRCGTQAQVALKNSFEQALVIILQKKIWGNYYQK